jgi:hypothetical protein
MPSRSLHVSPRTRGQIAPLALFGVLIASAVLVLMFNTGQQVTERSQVTNAADAAAYSGAVWTARHLNFMAYTNRAMIANHAAVGHFVSYVSWVRYVHDSIEAIDRVAQWLPYVGQYIDAVEQIAEHVRGITEESARIAVPALDAWNANLRAAQLETQASLADVELDALMQRTARMYDERIAINDADALTAVPNELRRLIESQIAAQRALVPAFVRRYSAANDEGALTELISATLRANADMQRWIEGERGWRETGIAFRLRKQGRTTNVQEVDGADWQARDQLQYGTRRLLGWSSWRRIGTRESTASAREFASNYVGVSSYYNLAGAPTADRALRIAAFATKPQRTVGTADLLGLSAPALPLSSAAVAVVEFRRPTSTVFSALAGNAQEYANLFNPFWEARLAPVLAIGE